MKIIYQNKKKIIWIDFFGEHLNLSEAITVELCTAWYLVFDSTIDWLLNVPWSAE